VIAAVLPVVLSLSFAAPDFDAAKAKALEPESLPKALAAIVSDCSSGDHGEQYDCRENMKAARKKLMGKDVYAYITPELNQIKYDGERGSKVRVLWFGLYDAGGGLALSVGKPHKVSARGTMVIRPTFLDGELASGVMANDIKRLARTGNIGVEVIGRFKGAWKLRGKGQSFQGVEMKGRLVRLINSRNGKTLMVAKLK
jgi:hypothetical protein